MPTRQIIIPPCVKDEMRKVIEQAGNRKFFWLDYIGAYIERDNHEIRKLHDTMNKLVITAIVSLALVVISTKTYLFPVFCSLSMTTSFALTFIHLRYIRRMAKAEKLMGKFMKETRDMTFKTGGGR